MKKILLILILLIIIGLFINGSLFTVKEGFSVIVTQWGKPIKTIESAGLCSKWTWQKVNTFDSKINCFGRLVISMVDGI